MPAPILPQHSAGGATTVASTTESFNKSVWHWKVVQLFRFGSDKNNTAKEYPTPLHCLQKSRPQRLYSTYSSTIAIHACQTKTVQKKKVSLRKIRRTLNNDMEQLSITGRRLNLSFVRSLDRFNLSSMTKLVLNRNQLYRDKHACRKLLQGLPNTLAELSLCWNGLDEYDALVLSGRLKKLEHLKSISLVGNPIGPRGVEALIEEGNLHHVSSVNLSDCDLGDEGAATLGCYLQLNSTSIETLNLDLNGISDIGLMALSKGLKTNPNMKSLDLYCNDFGEVGIKALMFAICSPTSNLEELYLRANRITDKGAQIIANRLNASSLRTLNIGYNEIGDMGASCIAESLSKNTNLRELKMSWNALSNKSITAFAAALVSNQSLQVCFLDENSNVDRRGASCFVKTLQTNDTLKSLEILDRSYENHLLNDKLDFLLKANKYGRRHVGDTTIPLPAWPLILEKMDGPEHVHMFLRERPDIFSNMCD